MTSFSIEKSFSKARQLMKRGEVQDAISIYQRVLEKYPQNQRASQALQNIFETGVGAAARRPPEETIRALTQNINAKKFNVVLAKAEELVKSYPSSAELWSAIGIASTQIDNQGAAINAFKKVISLNPKLPEAHNNLANAYKELGEFSLSETHYRIAINQRPDFVQARHHLGQVLVDLGKIEEAKNELEAVLEISPDHGDVYRILSSICKHEAEDVRVQRVAHLLDQNRLSEENKCHLHFTMAKMQEDIGDIASAFHHYVAGGAIRKKLLKYKPEKDTKLFASIKKTGATLQSIKLDIPSTKKGVRPIFIIGMPRSGTTLIEQILSRHSDVQAGGELNLLGKFGEALSSGKRQATPENLMSCRESYIRAVTKIADGRPVVTDKLPHNFVHVALIRTILPDAGIVHVNRDPFATCWSNFTHYFGDNLAYSYDLSDVVHQYHLFRDMMSFWKQMHGRNIVTLEYEALTINQFDETRALLRGLNLEWQEECLSPHKSKRVAQTNSKQQVRKKIYTGSSEKWRRFEPFLNGAFDELSQYNEA